MLLSTAGGWGFWDASWGWSCVLIALTLAIHATGIVVVARTVRRITVERGRRGKAYVHTAAGSVVLIVVVGLSLAILHAIESLAWAKAYLWLGAFTSPADAALYSLDSMTTRGESGLSMAPHWLMMGAAEAADGMLLFGISTAYLFAVMQFLWTNPARRRAARGENEPRGGENRGREG